MPSKLKRLSIIFLIMIIRLTAYSQESKLIMENDKQTVFKLSKYTVENERKIRKSFQSEPSYKLVYVCQETGLFVFEAKEKISPADKETIAAMIKNAIEKTEIHEERCTYKDAEMNCLLKSKSTLKK